ncbi:MAG TPA: DUF4383 domain-containing protein [Candidatus Dormibacteraeota bacterium]|nr:DUF4383 domain-containing protein [Candidatus Dormibacteraeota bacterium]
MANSSLARMAAGIFGAVYVLVGVLGFLPFVGGSYTLDPHNLLGLFAVNVVHNIVHLAVGFGGLAAYSGGEATSVLFARTVGIVYALLAVLGIVAGSGNFLGLVPIGGLDIGLHAVTALVLLYVGFAAPRREVAV